jgi:hypothetical protein
VSRPTDQLALVAGGAFIVLGVTGFLNTAGIVHLEWWWPVSILVLGAAAAVAIRSIQGLVHVAEPRQNRATPAEDSDGDTVEAAGDRLGQTTR